MDIPEDFVPQNFFGSKLFQYLELQINHTIINTKTSDSDYFLTNFFKNKINKPSKTLKQNGCFNGYWSDNNINAGTLSTLQNEITERRSTAEYFSSEKFYRYHLILNINLGLTESLKPLPKEVQIKLTFFRASAMKALLCTNLDASTGAPLAEYPKSSIELINPVLEAIYFKSEFYDRQLMPHLIDNLSWPFLEYRNDFEKNLLLI